MQVAIAHDLQRADIGVGAEHFAGFLAGQQAMLVGECIFLQALLLALQVTQVAGLDGDVDVAMLQIAIDRVALDALADDIATAQ